MSKDFEEIKEKVIDEAMDYIEGFFGGCSVTNDPEDDIAFKRCLRNAFGEVYDMAAEGREPEKDLSKTLIIFSETGGVGKSALLRCIKEVAEG